MGAGWEVSISESLHLHRSLPPAAGSQWSDRGKVGSFALLCFAGFGLQGLEIGVNLHKDAFWRVAEAGQ